MADLVQRAQGSRAASRALRTRCRHTRWASHQARQATWRLRRELFGAIHCADMSGGAFRVLVVDDLESVRTSFATVLRSAGFEVIEAADGFLALEAMGLLQFDAVVLDLAMPVLDGRGVLEGMKDALPVVLVSAGDYRSTVQAHGERIFGVVSKPVAPDVLVALVGEAATAGRASRR